MNSGSNHLQPSRKQVRTLSVIAFLMVAVSWSPLLPGLLSLNSSLFFLGTFLLFALITSNRQGLRIRLVLFCATLLAASMLLLLLTQSTTLWNRTAPLGFILFAAYCIVDCRRLVESLCTALSTWLGAGIFLSIVGFLYAYFGGEPVLAIENPDGRDNLLYLTTMSGSPIGRIIRPSWVYDEPGAFSFLICSTVALRHVLKMGSRGSLLLMIGGLITLSLTHFLLTVIYLILHLGFLRTATLAALLVAGANFLVPELEDLDFVSARFVVEDGRLAGDNRSEQIENFLAVAGIRTFFFGNIECHARPDRSCDEHGDISSSPATPTYYGGLLLLLAQLATHAALLVVFVRRRAFRLPALFLTILLLQRPYFAGFGYGLMTYICLFLMFKNPRTSSYSACSRVTDRAVKPAV
jgi:hypothetical protein